MIEFAVPESGRKKRLLISARDPGAAYHLVEIARRAAAQSGIEVRLVASSPAADIFKAADLPVERFDVGPLPGPDAPGATEVLAAARAVIDRLAPDALLVGLSGPGCGVDEALLHNAGNIPSYAFQDFWGSVNRGWGSVARTFFVIDEFAAEMTRRLTPSHVVVVGSPRYARAFGRDPSRVRDDARAGAEIADGETLIIFFGQPLQELPGYAETLKTLAAVCRSTLPESRVWYRSHPKEIAAGSIASLEDLRSDGTHAELDPWPDVVSSLCAADIACTCFSSCGLDHAFLNRAATSPLGSFLYLLFERDVAEYYRSFSRIEDIPLSGQGLASSVLVVDRLADALRDSILPALRRARWESARRNVGTPGDAAAAVVECIRRELF